jgi:hypothetical protein
LFADHGIVPFGFAVSNFLAESNQKKKIDMYVLAGDVCYCDLGSNGKHEFQSLWDLYQNQIEKLASLSRKLIFFKKLAFMFSSGNHEQYKNYTAFTNRIRMPETGGKRAQFFSYDYGGVHFVTMNTEFQYDSYAPGSPQYIWLENDLIKANNNRKNVPWIIVTGHSKNLISK